MPMRCPTLSELPSPPPGKTGWPCTEESPQLPDTMPDGSPWPRVSIITPSYNQGRFIEETIRSVLLQGYPDLEYIIIDGSSTDGSVDIIRKYEKWLAYWVSERDQGQSDAINKGFARATGEVLAWLNSDDVYLPGAVQEAASALGAHPTAALVYGQCDQCDATGTVLLRLGKPFDLDYVLLEMQNVIPQPSAFIRRRAAHQAGPLNTELYYVMDWDYWLRLAVLGDIQFVDSVWSKYRYYPASKSGNQSSRYYDELFAIYRSFLRRKTLPDHIARLRTAALLRLHLRAASRYYTIGQLAQARRHVLLAMQADWRTVLKPEWGRLLVCASVGLAWAKRLARIKQFLTRRLLAFGGNTERGSS